MLDFCPVGEDIVHLNLEITKHCMATDIGATCVGAGSVSGQLNHWLDQHSLLIISAQQLPCLHAILVTLFEKARQSTLFIAFGGLSFRLASMLAG
jgi:hypothetical protein